MLIWINGPFGGGKTQTAHELQRRLADSIVCDPEHVGFGLHRMMPPEMRGDFQDLPAWRQGVYEVLDLVLGQHPGPVIVPMTVVEPTYLDEIVGRLRRNGHDVRHFALLAERDAIVRRLRERGFGHALQWVGGRGSLRRESFAVANIDRCLTKLRGPGFAEHIWTDNRTIAEVADHIAASAQLHLSPNTDRAFRGRIRRACTGIKHIRVG